MTVTEPAMSPEQAKAILDAFGPCTTTFECTTTEELIKDFADETYKGSGRHWASLEEFANLLVRKLKSLMMLQPFRLPNDPQVYRVAVSRRERKTGRKIESFIAPQEFGRLDLNRGIFVDWNTEVVPCDAAVDLEQPESER